MGSPTSQPTLSKLYGSKWPQMGIRFLTDHLEDDRYYRVQRPAHNLDRARAQLCLGERMEQCQPRLREIVDAAGISAAGLR